MRKMKHLFAVTTAVAALGFDNDAGWKKDENGALVADSDGNPIFIGDDGKETTYTTGYINHLNNESAKHRKAARDAQSKLEAFGDLDAKEARAAVEKMKDVNLDDLVNKGEIETVKASMREAFEAENKTLAEQLAQAQRDADNLRLSNAFNSSEFLNDRLAVPRDFVQSAYRDRFKIEEGKVIPVKSDGEPLRNKHGDIASVDEAFETFINERSDKDALLKAPAVGGSGSQGGGGGRGGSNVMKRSDYDALSPGDQAAIGQKVAKGEMQVVD